MRGTKPTSTKTNEGTAMESVRSEHDSFGRISLAHSQRTSCSLFGSTLTHQHVVTIEVSRAHMERRDGRERLSVVDEDAIVRFAMSESQWARFISSMGNGEGTPVTLERAPSKGTHLVQMPSLAPQSMHDASEDDMREVGRKAGEAVAAVQERMRAFLVPGAKMPTKKEIEAMHDALLDAGRHMDGNMAQARRAFTETMEKTVDEAKTEMETFAMDMAKRLGLEKMARDGQALVGLTSGTVDEAE